MIKRLLILISIIGAIALYSGFCYWISFLFNGGTGDMIWFWFVLNFLLLVPIGIGAAGLIFYGLAQLICWIKTGVCLEDLPEKKPVKKVDSSKVRKIKMRKLSEVNENPYENNPDYQEALKELEKI